MGDALAGIAGWHEMGLPPWEAGVFAPGATLEREEARYLAGLACLKQHRQTNDRAAAREQ